MSKLPILKPKQAVKKFEKLGFVVDRQLIEKNLLMPKFYNHKKSNSHYQKPQELEMLRKGNDDEVN